MWLFGSRVDDAKKGGDIDLLVCPQSHTASDAAEGEQGFMQKIKMLTLLERHLGERKVDLVVEQPQDMRPIVEVAHKTGIKLQWSKLPNKWRCSTAWLCVKAMQMLFKMPCKIYMHWL